MLYGHDQGKNIKQLSDDTNDVVCVKMGGTGKASHTANAVLTGNGEDAVKNVVTANGALYATAANGAPKFGTLPIAQGGTGKTTAADALAALGGASIKKVWENASIGSTFGAQTLQISTTADYILILTNRGVIIVVPKNAGRIIYYGCEAYPNQRGFTYTDNSLAVTIGEALNSGWQTNNNVLKPWYIFEIKGVL